MMHGAHSRGMGLIREGTRTNSRVEEEVQCCYPPRMSNMGGYAAVSSQPSLYAQCCVQCTSFVCMGP